MDIDKIQDQIVEEFSEKPDLLKKYQSLIDLGKALPEMDPNLKNDSYLIKGCASSTWIAIELVEGKLRLSGDSDTLITKGLLSLLIRIYDNQTPADAIKFDIDFPDKIGLRKNLSPSRFNGLGSMIKHIKQFSSNSPT